MTPEQEKVFVKVAICGTTMGLRNPLEWLASYDRGFQSVLPIKEREKAREKVWDAFVAFYAETGPGPGPDVHDLSCMVNDYYLRCCFPGCYIEGEYKVPGKENTNLLLCPLHEECLHAPNQVSTEKIP